MIRSKGNDKDYRGKGHVHGDWESMATNCSGWMNLLGITGKLDSMYMFMMGRLTWTKRANLKAAMNNYLAIIMKVGLAK